MENVKPDIENVLRKMRLIALRQEQVAFNRDFFVDEKLTDALSTNNWQVLFGRRGTGKTTNLQSLADASKDTKSIAIYVDLSATTPSDFGMSTDSEAQRVAATNYFQDFVKTFCRELFECYTDRKNENFISRMLSKDSKDFKRAEDIVLEIASLADEGKFIVKPETMTKKRGDDEESNARIKANISAKGPTVEAGIGSNSSRTSGHVQTFIFTEVSRYHELSTLLKELCQLLDVERIYILIDEWTSMDKSGKLEIQPLFAELLNRTFKQIKGLSIKISAIRGTTVLFRQDAFSQIGLEVGEDIYEVEDLDVLHANNDGKNTFFEKLIFKKMVEADKSILYYSKENETGQLTGDPSDGFVRSFFSDSNLFDMLVEASGRIPRLFIELFTDISSTLGYKASEKWERQKILDEIVRRSIIKKQEIEQQDKFRAFYSKACQIVKATNQRVFFVPRRQSLLFADIISNLFHFKMIHNVYQQIIPTELDREYRLYTLDYGTYLHITGKCDNDRYFLKNLDLSIEDYVANSDWYTIQASDLELEISVCRSCDRAVSMSHPAVVNANVCYHCFNFLAQ